MPKMQDSGKDKSGGGTKSVGAREAQGDRRQPVDFAAHFGEHWLMVSGGTPGTATCRPATSL